MTDENDKSLHDKEVEKRYEEISQSIDDSNRVSKKIINSGKAGDDIEDATRKLINIKKEYNDIMSRDFEVDSLCESLPIETLKDLQDIEREGKPKKFQYNDLLKASSLKREGEKIIRSRDELLHRQRMSQLELLEAKINELIKVSEN